MPDDAGLTVAFKEGRRVNSRHCARRSDTEGRRQDKSAGMKVDRNRLMGGAGLCLYTAWAKRREAVRIVLTLQYGPSPFCPALGR